MFKGFRDFLLRGNIVDLAVAVVIGSAFNTIVQALVKDIIGPFIGIFGGVPDFSQLAFTINNSKFYIGDFLNALLSFLIMATVIYFFVALPVNKLSENIGPRKEKEENTKECPHCYSTINKKAKRCAFCTSQLTKK